MRRGFTSEPGHAVDASAYEQFTGRWSRLFVPLVLEAADVQPGDQVLDMCTGTGEAAVAIASTIGPSGCLIGVDIAPLMLESARGRLNEPTFLPVAADGQALPFSDRCFDAVVCQLGLLSKSRPRIEGVPTRASRWGSRRNMRHLQSRPRPDVGHPCRSACRLLPAQQQTVHLSFSLDPTRLETLLINAGFQEVRIERQTREDSYGSFDEYWDSIEAGIGSIPQTYLMLPDAARLTVRQEVRAKLAEFEADRRLRLEMLIGSGVA